MPVSDGTDGDDDGPSHTYPPSEWSVEELTTALGASEGITPLPTYDDAEVWASIRGDDTLASVVGRLRTEATAYREEPVPRVSARQFQDVAEHGRKSRSYYETLRRQRRGATVLALAECLDRDGRSLDTLVEHVWALCEQTSWLNPRQVEAAASVDGLPRPARTVAPTDRNVTHYTVWTAHELAEVDHLLGDRLPAGVRDRLREEIDVRLFKPYEARDDFWWLHEASNWNAVCSSRTAVTALSVLEDDTDRLGRIVTKAVHSLGGYLDCFDADGSTPEGVMYWDYGMRYYAELAAHLDARTEGRYSLFEPPVVRAIARFPHRVGFRPGRYPPFNDSLERYAPRPSTFFRLGEWFDDPAVVAHGWRVLTDETPAGDLHNFPPVDVPSLVRAASVDDVIRTEATGERYAPPATAFFSGNDWWVARADPADPDGLVVATKGGHNGEPHNHNDCGSFVVSHRDESLLADLARRATAGSTAVTAATTSSQLGRLATPSRS
ncbi:heparinase [Halomarina oriensis]|uniref:Heparinase n=1 Tax=Halomarina oriensis TaxID=671145 RepID=A0A6B0GGB7_9EURY|nr:heparinase [Halomarina oriensis]MWG33862.1 heparinase [Halomarina oriensis]